MSEHEWREWLEKTLRRIEHKIDFLIRLHKEHKAHSLVLIIKEAKGNPMGQPLKVHISDTPGMASVQEFTGTNGTGTLVPPIGPVVFASDNPSVATVDPASGQLAYVTAGTANISAVDQGNGLSDSTALTIVADLAQSLLETLAPGTPVPTAALRGKKK